MGRSVLFSSKPNMLSIGLNLALVEQTVDSNSAYFAKFCFSLGINLKRIEVIADDEGEIIEATRRLSDNVDLVVTSGGIGKASILAPDPLLPR